jgi:hypothetical protein
MRSLACIVLAVRVAAAEPRVVTAPTAWLPTAGTAYGNAQLDHRGDGAIDVGLGLGGLAAVEVGEDSEVRRCETTCTGPQHAIPIRQGRATFRLGARQDAWFAGQPALVLGVAESVGGSTGAQVGQAYIVASRTLGPLIAHAGGELLDARAYAGAPRLGTTLRPFGALELVPPQYPKTTLMVDLAWLPVVQADRASVEWLIGWGVRYQALTWGSIELDVRHREGEGLAGSTVFVRVNGVWSRAL